MAIGLQNTDNVDAPDSDYPYGKVRDNDGSGNGTQANTKTLGDFHQFFAKIMDAAGIIANGLPDNDLSGFQYFEALKKVIGSVGYDNIEDVTIQTDNSGAVTTIITVPIPLGKTCNIEVKMLATFVSGAGSSTDSSSIYKILTYVNIAGVLTQVGSTVTGYDDQEGSSSPMLILNVSGSSLRIRYQVGGSPIFNIRAIAKITSV